MASGKCLQLISLRETEQLHPRITQKDKLEDSQPPRKEISVKKSKSFMGSSPQGIILAATRDPRQATVIVAWCKVHCILGAKSL